MSVAWNEVFGDQLVTKDGLKSTLDTLADKEVVGIYFSAHWCPPCRGFTPFLSAVYDDMIEEHPEFELVFVSSDHNEANYKEYYDEMPFKALPFDNRLQRDLLAQTFRCSGIPYLVFMNNKGGIVTLDGRTMVAESRGDVEKLWKQLTAETA